MGDKTGIQWTDATWNPIRGCSRVSEGCRHCYAETVANRFKGPGQPYEGLIARSGQWNGKIAIAQHLMDQPIRWQKRRRIFVNSMSDLFHENVPDHIIDRVFGIMWACLYGRNEQDGHVFQVLTKRPERMREYLTTDRREAWAQTAVHYGGGIDPDGLWDQTMDFEGPHPRIWLGVSVENQATADERIPLLLETPAAVRWISAEPLLGEVDLSWAQCTCPSKGDAARTRHLLQCPADRRPHRLWSIDWVVVGGESGPGARPMHPEWARSLRDQCQAAGVPFFFKQWGEWSSYCPLDKSGALDFSGGMAMANDGTLYIPHDLALVGGKRRAEALSKGHENANLTSMYRRGKKAAGRLLDGREWNEYPQQEKPQ